MFAFWTPVFLTKCLKVQSQFFIALFSYLHTEHVSPVTSAGANSSTFLSVKTVLPLSAYLSISTSLCAGSGVTGNCLWLENSHKVTHSPVALVWQRPGRFNPSVLRINLMFLDSLAQSKGPDGTLCPLRKAQHQAKGWSTEGEAHLFNKKKIF